MPLIADQTIFLADLCRLIGRASQTFAVTEGEGERPQWVQDIYFEQGKSKAKMSQHSKRLATDLHFYKLFSPSGEYQEITNIDELRPLGEYWKSLDPKNRWGGDFVSLHDPWHFERHV